MHVHIVDNQSLFLRGSSKRWGIIFDLLKITNLCVVLRLEAGCYVWRTATYGTFMFRYNAYLLYVFFYTSTRKNSWFHFIQAFLFTYIDLHFSWQFSQHLLMLTRSCHCTAKCKISHLFRLEVKFLTHQYDLSVQRNIGKFSTIIDKNIQRFPTLLKRCQ